MAYRRRRAGMHLNSEINVVSLIDVMLLLLVIFMLTAPMMQGGMDVDLPEVNAQSIQTKGGLKVIVERSGVIYINETRMTNFAAFRAAFPKFVEGHEKDGVDVFGDSAASVGTLLQVMGVLQAAGVTKIGFPTLPEDRAK